MINGKDMIMTDTQAWNYAVGMIKVDGLEPTPEFREYIEKEKNIVSPGWLHHKGRNKHHFEYWIDFSCRASDKPYGILPCLYYSNLFLNSVGSLRITINSIAKQISNDVGHEIIPFVVLN